MKLPAKVEEEIVELEVWFAPKGGQQAGAPRFRGLREAVAAALSAASAASAAKDWQPIATAPTDGTLFLAYAPGREGLPAMQSLCAWHPDAGFCIDELRIATHWMPLPDPPKESR